MISIGTDCSGIEAPVQALLQMGISFQHVWSCENDSYAIQSIHANYTPEKIYSDITTRNHLELPDTDIYVCGFPCQPFSLMGNKKGTSDPRSNIMLHCIETIKIKTPNIFILENVKNFKFIEKGVPFNYLLNTLSQIKENEEEIYNVYSMILNTKDYGLPQNRERIFIIGIKKEIQLEEFTIPEKVEMKPLEDIIQDKTIHNRQLSRSFLNNINKIKDNNKDNYIITPFTFFSNMKFISPALTTNCHCYYLTNYNRCLSTKECLLLQGFPKNFKQVVSNNRMYKQIGNSMSVNVLVALFHKIYKTTIYKELI